MIKNVKIKICGIVTEQDVELMNACQPDYVGMVLFYPKSKRNLTVERAKRLMEKLDRKILRVAVVVSPNVEELEQIEQAGFDRIQVHGKLTEEFLSKVRIPVFRACNVADRMEKAESDDKIEAYVLDAKIPGSGEQFDWSLMEEFDSNGKLVVLAGGLRPDNVQEGIHLVEPDVVDVSSGVENENGIGKNPDQVWAFVKAVREQRQKLI